MRPRGAPAITRRKIKCKEISQRLRDPHPVGPKEKAALLKVAIE